MVFSPPTPYMAILTIPCCVLFRELEYQSISTRIIYNVVYCINHQNAGWWLTYPSEKYESQLG
jgi:hypothetical protein